MARSILLAAALAATALSPRALHAEPLRGGGKLLLTNGISSVDGASGGGLTPWAAVAGNETGDGVGAQVAATWVHIRDYEVRQASVAVGIFDRIELSASRQSFDTNEVGAALGIGEDYKFEQDIVGAKIRLAGDAVYGASAMPAIAIGIEAKHNRNGSLVRALGARSDDGVDFYASATKLFLARSILVNGTLRLTRANQFGLLGFGGDLSNAYSLQPEASAAYQLSRSFVIGAEYRSKPDKLGIAREDDAFDLFVAKAFGRHVTATAAYTDLGSIATMPRQRGFLLQLQAGY